MKNISPSSLEENQSAVSESSEKQKANVWSFLWRSFLVFILTSILLGVVYKVGSLIVQVDALKVIQYKNTIVFLFIGALFGVLALLYKRNNIRPLFSQKIAIQHQQWYFLNALMAALFLSLSALNLLILLTFSVEAWVTYKLFSGLFVYVAICIIAVLASKKGSSIASD